MKALRQTEQKFVSLLDSYPSLVEDETEMILTKEKTIQKILADIGKIIAFTSGVYLSLRHRSLRLKIQVTNTLSEKNIESFGPVSVDDAKDNLEFKEKELNLSSESNEQLKALKIELENNFKKLSKMENKLKLEILNKSKEIETLQLTVLNL